MPALKSKSTSRARLLSLSANIWLQLSIFVRDYAYSPDEILAWDQNGSAEHGWFARLEYQVHLNPKWFVI
jgi:hypothetical protein